MSEFKDDSIYWLSLVLFNVAMCSSVLLFAKITEHIFFLRLYYSLIFVNFGICILIYMVTINSNDGYINVIQFLIIGIQTKCLLNFYHNKQIKKIYSIIILILEIVTTIMSLYIFVDTSMKKINYYFYIFCMTTGTTYIYQFILIDNTSVYKTIKDKYRFKQITSFSKEEECSICLEKFVEPVVKTECKHLFHKECIERAYEQNTNCPLCRMNLV
jgi:hypothetical protein